MRTAAGVWCVAVVSFVSVIGLVAADEIVSKTHQTEHYDVDYEGNLDAEELGKLLESLHAKLTRFFGGKTPEQRLRLVILADEERFKAALADAGQPYEGGGGVYGPTFKTAWLFVQPSQYYTRHLMLHEATHQFHYLVATGNEAPAAEWYLEGLADYMGQHTWDGEQLQVGVVPLISLEDYPAQAIAEFDEAEWDLASIVAGQRDVGRGAGWMLVHFLINRDYETFRKLASRLDGRNDPTEAFTTTFGEVTDELVQDLKRWVTQHQQPFDDVWIEWQAWGAALEGRSEGVALCLAKQTPQRFEVEIHEAEGEFRAGVAFGFQGPRSFRMLQIWGDGKAHFLRRDQDKWTVTRSVPVPPADGDDRIVVEQIGEDSAVLTVNGDEVHRMPAPGRVGLTVDGCRARFRVKGVPPISYRNLAALMDPPAPILPEPPPIPEPNRRDAEGRTRLHVSALEGNAAAAERLLASGADVERTLDNGVTPLMMAAFKGNREIVQLLLKAGADVRRTTPRGTTALHYAAAGGDLPLVQCFLAAGAEVDARKPGGTTPLILAAQNGHANAIDTLLEAGANVNRRLADQAITGLMLAAQNGHARAVSTLLRTGADSRKKDSSGRTALDYARANEHTAVVEILEKAAAEIEREVSPESEEVPPKKKRKP